MTHRLEQTLSKARTELIAEQDLDDGLEKAVDVLVAAGVVSDQQRDAARLALEEAVGLTVWRRRAKALTEADAFLVEDARSQLEWIEEDELADRIYCVAREVGDMLPGADDMPREEVVGLREMVEGFPALLLERLLATERPSAESLLSQAAG